MFRTDSDIQKDVVAELKWEPGLMDDDIAVSVREGVVTLAGFVNSWADKYRAERVVGRVIAGSGAPGRKSGAGPAFAVSCPVFTATFTMRIASVGQACTQAGASPSASRWWHMSHLRTMPRFFEYFGTSKGHFRMQ